jgi:hypothetical protein
MMQACRIKMQIKYFIENTGDFPISVENRSGDIELVMLRPGEVCEIMPVEDVVLKVIRENKMSYYTVDNVESYVPDTKEKRKIQKSLEKGIHEVVWNSQHGVKTMEVTLDDKYIPGEELLTESLESVNQTQKGAETVRAYSTDRQGWRSFNVNNVLSIVSVQK